MALPGRRSRRDGAEELARGEQEEEGGVNELLKLGLALLCTPAGTAVAAGLVGLGVGVQLGRAAGASRRRRVEAELRRAQERSPAGQVTSREAEALKALRDAELKLDYQRKVSAAQAGRWQQELASLRADLADAAAASARMCVALREERDEEALEALRVAAGGVARARAQLRRHPARTRMSGWTSPHTMKIDAGMLHAAPTCLSRYIDGRAGVG